MTDTNSTESQIMSLEEELLEVILVEANPKNWPGAAINGQIRPMQMTQQERGDRYWCKKNAAATMTLSMKLMQIREMQKRVGTSSQGLIDSTNDDADMEKQIKELENKAMKKLLNFHNHFS